MKTFIKVRWDFVGFHKYKDAPNQVGFLQNVHRHKFFCSAKIEVFHEERELEFFIVQEDLKSNFSDGNMDGKSCETMCMMILAYLGTKYGRNRKYEVEVSEDGENSAIVEV